MSVPDDDKCTFMVDSLTRFRGMFFWYHWTAQTLLPLTERVHFFKSRFRVEFFIIRALAVVVFTVCESLLREQAQLIS
jgi:hypothetical protein